MNVFKANCSYLSFLLNLNAENSQGFAKACVQKDDPWL